MSSSTAEALVLLEQEGVKYDPDVVVLVYCEVLDWFEGKPHPKSPEGHVWGREAHQIIGTELAGVIRHLD